MTGQSLVANRVSTADFPTVDLANLEKQCALGRLRSWSLKIEALATKHPSFVRDAQQGLGVTLPRDPIDNAAGVARASWHVDLTSQLTLAGWFYNANWDHLSAC